MTNPVPSDLFIINDGDETRSINYGSFRDSILLDTQAADLVFTGSVGLSGIVTIDGVVTVNGDVSFLGDVGGIGITQLTDVTIVGTPSNGQVLTWNTASGYWEAQPAGVEPNTIVDSINGLVGDVVLDADSLDDTNTAHKFVTFDQREAINTALQPGDNVSDLTNDANYIPVGGNVSDLTNDAGYLTSATSDVQSVNGLTGVVVLDPDDLDDTSTDHKFATSVQLGLAETAVQPTESINALADVDTVSSAPVEGDSLVYNGTDWIPGTASTRWDVTPNVDQYNFSGFGFDGTEVNPTIYVTRGQKYYFNVNASGHPFTIQSDTGVGGTAYNDGITNNGDDFGLVVWEVQMDAPDEVYYQCAVHAAMNGIIKILSAPIAEVFVDVINDTGSDITKGSPVYISGTHASGKPTIALADSDGASTYPSIGLASLLIADGAEGKVLISGILQHVNTSSFSAGEALYLDTTPGALINARPSLGTTKVQKVGLVTRSHASSGSVLVIGAGRTNDVPNELTALTGVAKDSLNLGTFTGSTIADSSNIKDALQSLESAVEVASGGSIAASNFTFDASMIPDTNAAYDLGSAEFKVRHLYLSDNSIKFESGDLNVAAGNLAWQGETILPTTIANLLSVLGVESHLDNGAALSGGLVPGDVYYNITDSKLKSVTA